jgi:hypothetical protein
MIIDVQKKSFRLTRLHGTHWGTLASSLLNSALSLSHRHVLTFKSGGSHHKWPSSYSACRTWWLSHPSELGGSLIPQNSQSMALYSLRTLSLVGFNGSVVLYTQPHAAGCLNASCHCARRRVYHFPICVLYSPSPQSSVALSCCCCCCCWRVGDSQTGG